MSYTTALGVAPDRQPVVLAEFRNAHGWSPSIWSRLAGKDWFRIEGAELNRMWRSIETLPEWQQIPLLLTFDTGVIPFQEYAAAALALDEFERRLPERASYVNHVPAVADLLRSCPEAPFFGIYGTSVSENPFDPWDYEADDHGSGIPLSGMYVLERHRHHLAATSPR